MAGELPEGFTLDAPTQQPQGLPQGFTLDAPAQQQEDPGVFSDFGQGVRRGIEKITGGATQRIVEGLMEFNLSELRDLTDKVNSGEIELTEDVQARVDRLSILNEQTKSALGGAEERETQRRGEFQPIQERSPIASTVGEIAGQIIPTLAFPGAQAATLPGRIAQGVATGASIGGAQPTVGEESVLENVAVGGLTGGVAPVALEKVLAPAAKAVIRKFSDIKVNKLLDEAAPSVDTLKESARTIYQKIDDSGAKINKEKVTSMANNVIATLKKSGASEFGVTPKAEGLIQHLNSVKGAELTIGQVDDIRQAAGVVAGELNKKEARLGVITIDKIDNFLDDLNPDAFGGVKNIGSDLREARKFWGRAVRADMIDQAFKLAENQASGFENGLRVQFRQLLNRIDKGKLRGFSPEEIKAMRTVEQGTTAANLSKLLGKFGITTEKSVQALIPGGGAAAAFAAGGGGAAAAVIGVGTVSKLLARKLTDNNAKLANSIIKAGPNAKQITKAYLSNVPKSKRSADELTELLMRPDVDLGTIKETGNKLVDDAVFFARQLQKPAIIEATGEE